MAALTRRAASMQHDLLFSDDVDVGAIELDIDGTAAAAAAATATAAAAAAAAAVGTLAAGDIVRLRGLRGPKSAPVPDAGDFCITLDISELGLQLEDRRLSSALGTGVTGGGFSRIYSICQAYSTPEGCPLGDGCAYDHACNKPGCFKAHPGHMHSVYVQEVHRRGGGGARMRSRPTPAGTVYSSVPLGWGGGGGGGAPGGGP